MDKLYSHKYSPDLAVFFNPVKDRPMTYNAIVKKETINAIVRTASEKIEGKISKPPNNRLLDILNQRMRGLFLQSMPKCFVWLPGMFDLNRNFLQSINNILF